MGGQKRKISDISPEEAKEAYDSSPDSFTKGFLNALVKVDVDMLNDYKFDNVLTNASPFADQLRKNLVDAFIEQERDRINKQSANLYEDFLKNVFSYDLNSATGRVNITV